ncbi:MAG: hypothetical protein M3680_23950 [Myxococcota bacterium]|nr:hypothetical protein [Myxococcota bacterium]
MTLPWKFTKPPGPRAPQVVLVAFARGPLAATTALTPEPSGAPSPAALAACTVQTVARGTDPAWFDAWHQGSLRAVAEADLGADVSLLDAADHAHVIISAPAAATDLTYLQAAWAHARHVVARGAAVVLDAIAMRFLQGAQLPPAGAPLDVSREVRVIFEASAGAAGAHALHTRGLRKFGAPDLIALCTNADARLVAHAISELADEVARGTELATPTHAVHVAPGVTWVAVEDEHRLGELLQLDNAARVLVDEAGHDLVGVVERLARPVN